MAYRTLVLHLTNEARARALVEAAMGIAQRHEAHLIGLYVIPSVEIHVAAEVPVTADILSAQREFYTEQAGSIRAIFDKITTEAGFSCEWRTVDATGASVTDAVMAHGRCADLIICGQSDPANDPASLLRVGEDVMMASGRPVLFIPTAGTFPTIGNNATVAWNGSREAARAAFDALPMLKMAKQVRILAVNPDDTDLHGTTLPGSELATSLSRHGVKCEAAHSVAADIGVGDELLSRLADRGSDLLVMGGFGHSRFRQFVFGGATRSILGHMTVPVLMSH
jgi:nucleotide-binding universal stress UspA family protein